MRWVLRPASGRRSGAGGASYTPSEQADFLHILQRLFLSQDGELIYSLRFGVACSVEPGAGGEPAVWWAPRAKRKRAAAFETR